MSLPSPGGAPLASMDALWERSREDTELREVREEGRVPRAMVQPRARMHAEGGASILSIEVSARDRSPKGLDGVGVAASPQWDSGCVLGGGTTGIEETGIWVGVLVGSGVAKEA